MNAKRRDDLNAVELAYRAQRRANPGFVSVVRMPDEEEPFAFMARHHTARGFVIVCHDCVAASDHPEPISEAKFRHIGRLNCDGCQRVIAPVTV